MTNCRYILYGQKVVMEDRRFLTGKSCEYPTYVI